jgi:hypothetical protein
MRASLSRCHKKRDPRPVTPYVVRQFQPGHGPRHVNIGEQRSYLVGLAGKQAQSVVGMRGLDDNKPGICQNIHGHHPYEHLVLGNKDDD